MTEALAIVGATATGKTALSLALAETIPAEVISMDSRQIYRGMDIGTGKVEPAEATGVPHWGIDLVEPTESFSAGEFARAARGWIGDIRDRGRLPLLVGGTGFYLRALVHPVFREPELDRERTARLRSYLAQVPLERLEDLVGALDPVRAEMAVAGGRQRMSRTVELALLTGRPLSWWHASAPPEAPPVAARTVHLILDRDELHRRIDARVRSMVGKGLADEVRGLLDAGCSTESPGMSAMGYREMAEHLAGRISLEEAIDLMTRSTRHYARRQLTWFRNQLPADTVQVSAALALDAQVGAALEAIR
ncbi:MAG: tRNA (adenosine(37)-N6)-dimethylallyltransferase MiaA [Gemmatimonadetes bacterium]|nr:tRNA (adenosine(37)-N6)-dimethylallyltransferase MiaA [Gemmatimonadota bacterium]